MDSDIPNVGPGTVRLVGLVEHDSRFSIDGLDRRWDFSGDDGSYDFAIVIEPTATEVITTFHGFQPARLPARNSFTPASAPVADSLRRERFAQEATAPA